MKKINNNGYMLIEIILASIIAFAIAAFALNLTIKLKNKNDDEMVNTLTTTDMSIITNKIMEYAIAEKENFNCDKLKLDNGTITYNGEIVNIFNKYVNPDELTCSMGDGELKIFIPIDVPQMPENDYDIKINYKYNIDNISYPDISLVVPDGSTWKRENSFEIRLFSSAGLKTNKTYKIKYQWGTSKISCDKMTYESTITVPGSETKEYISQTFDIDIEHGAGTGKGRIYVCNIDPIEDVNGNSLPGTITSEVMYLDNTPPTVEWGISGYFTATIKCSDNDSGIEGETNFTRKLSGTKDKKIEFTCTDIVGNENNSSHTYKYGCVEYGDEECDTCPYDNGYVCRQYSTTNPTSPGCAGIPGCVDCYHDKGSKPCNCYTPCDKYGFKK